MKGIGASPGYAAGRVFIKKEFKEPQLRIVENSEAELEQLKVAQSQLMEKLVDLEKLTTETIGEEEGQIFKAHQMMLNDPELIGKIKSYITSKSYEASYATKLVRDEMVTLFMGLDNDYMKERAADIKDVCNGLMKNLLGIEDIQYNSDEKVIIVAHDLTPSDTASIPKEAVSGFITAIGGVTSHTAIMSRTLEIPAVVGVSDLSSVKEGDFIILNGESGEIVLNPSKEVLETHQKHATLYDKEKELLKQYKGQATVSKDGIKVELACNIGHPDDLKFVTENDGEGIGLFRSEFLYMNRSSMPDESEQFEAYKSALVGMNGPVVIRTLDVGGDKQLSYLDFPKEENPFLGYRAIRYCLDHPEVFKVQLRALLRASVFGDLKIMLPMISNINEIRKTKEMINEVKADLTKEKIAFGSYELGIMIEIPAAAIISDQLAREVDFFSIGTNDLIQYTTAVDRMNEHLSALYSPYHPALIRLIKTVIENGHNADIWVGMCGEVAGNQALIPLLFAMGLDEFSMSPSSVLKSRALIHSLDKTSCKKMLDDVLKLSTSEEIEAYLKRQP